MQSEVLTDKQRQFAEDNHKLIYSFLLRYGFSIEDWYGVAAIGYCQAVRDFDPKRCRAFSTFAYRVMLNCVLKEKRKAGASKRHAVLVSLQSEVCDGCILEDVLAFEGCSAEDCSLAGITDFINAMNAEHQLIIASLAIGETQNEIGDKINLSQAQVSRTIKTIRVRFRNEFLYEAGRAGDAPARLAHASGEGTVHV